MRLIDADKIKPEDFYDRVNMEECMEVINEQPTAYDVEAVVRELEDAKFVFYTEDDKEASGYNDGLNEAIEIVRRGGRNE